MASLPGGESAALVGYAAVFFGAMVVHELALEGASATFPHLDALTSAVTLFQFGSCFLLPLALTWGGAGRCFPRSFAEAMPYVKLSFVVAGATALATRSLVYVSYPTKVHCIHWRLADSRGCGSQLLTLRSLEGGRRLCQRISTGSKLQATHPPSLPS